ncbi:hypothetical protein C8R43DRAFT_1024703 [Mycena crocata]|nr:hypothetical protein C8R43DRAFT_1024703 [Mycena crocata]
MHLTPEAAARHEQAEREPLPPHEAKDWMVTREREDVERLVEITSADFETAARLLRKHDGDLNKAVDAFFSGAVDDPEEKSRDQSIANLKQDFGHLFENQGQKSVIDLTGEDDPAADSQTRFRATTRSPDPSWQMVRSTNVTSGKTADEELNEVIQASYNDFAAEESDIIPPEDMTLRKDGRPIALRADTSSKAYAALVIQALFHVPQIRQRCSQLRLHHVETDGTPPTGHDYAIWTLIELFTSLELGQISVFLDIDVCSSWNAAPLTQGDSVGAMSRQFLEKIAGLVQNDLDEQEIDQGPDDARLFHFTFCHIQIPVSGPPETIYESDTGHVLRIETGSGVVGDPELAAYNDSSNFTSTLTPLPPTSIPSTTFNATASDSPSHATNPHKHTTYTYNRHDLVARLSQTFNHYNADGSSDHQLITRPSELVVFEISVDNSGSSVVGGSSSGNADASTISASQSNSSMAPNGAPAAGETVAAGVTAAANTNTANLNVTIQAQEPQPLVYPKTIYMDQFLEVNLDLANETRAAQRVLMREVGVLRERKRGIVAFEGQDSLGNLRATIYYYEHVAECSSPARLLTLQTVAGKLKNTLAKMEREVKEIDEKIANLQLELDALFDNPELQCHPYDLRAVLVHTGLPGRKHIYSYVFDKGTWWKTVDYMVTEVTEDVVLSDPAGLHLGAGPYMLMYSRRQSEEEMNTPVQWPRIFADTVVKNNERLFEEEAMAMQTPAGERDEDAMDTT